MKTLTTLISLTITTFLLNACSASKTVTPSQNSALNSVTSSHKQKSGAMQESLDNWLEKEWTPTVEKDEKIKEKYKAKERDFTLQEYVDKSEVYIRDNNSTYENSHSKKISSMPVIGK